MRVSIWVCCAWVETHARFQSVTETHIIVHRNWWVSLCNRKHILNTLRVFLRLAAWSVETHARFLHCSTLWWETHVRFHVFFDFWRETHACFLRLGFLWWETQARFQIQALQRRETLFLRFSVWKSLICARLYSACCVSIPFFLLLPCWRSMLPAGGTDWVMKSEAPLSAATMTVWKKQLLLSTEKLSWHNMTQNEQPKNANSRTFDNLILSFFPWDSLTYVITPHLML